MLISTESEEITAAALAGAARTSSLSESAYAPLLSVELDDDPTDTDDSGSGRTTIHAVANNVLVPITRRPTSTRDTAYAVMFVAQFVVVSLLSLLEKESIRDSLVEGYGNVGSFSSMFMLVILLSSLLGGAVVFVLANDDVREVLLRHGILVSVAFQVCLGNVILLTKSRYSWIGVLVLIMAYMDSRRYKDARDKVSFTSALLKLVIDVCEPYGISLCIACFAVVAGQACALLWWGVLFVGLISGASLHSGYAELLIVVMGLSLYWVTQFFHAFMSYLVGGCVLWYFFEGAGKDVEGGNTTAAITTASSSSSSSSPTDDPSGRVMFSMSLGLSTSLGSIAKGALFSPLAEAVMSSSPSSLGQLQPWQLSDRNNNIIHSSSGRSSSSGSSGGFNMSSCCQAPRAPMHAIAARAAQHSRLAMPFAAIYGTTYARSAADVASTHSELIDIAADDATSFSLCAVAKELATVLAVLFGVLAERREGQDWPLFFFVSFLLGYCSCSLTLHVYSAAVDAIILAYAARPDQLRHINSIVFLRFVRTTEAELR